MKKPTIFKKSFALILSVIMIASSMVFASPVTANAVSAGNYFVRISYWVTDTVSGGTFTIQVNYANDNGTGSASSSTQSMEMSVADGHTMDFNLSGFPTSVLITAHGSKFWDGGAVNVWGISIGPDENNLTEAWNGELHFESQSNNYYGTLTAGSDGGSFSGNNSSYATFNQKDTDVKNFKLPYASSMSASYASGDVTCPKTSSASSASNTLTYGATDQYGVTMASSLCSVSVSGSSSGTNGISTSGSGGSATTYCSSAANIAGTLNQQTVTATCSWSGSESRSNSASFTLHDASYAVSFLNAYGVAMSTQNVYYGSTASAPTSPDKSADDSYHYTFSSWSPAATTAITADTTFTPQFTSAAHAWDDGVVTTEPTCTEKGAKTYTCMECSQTKTEEIAALGHDYTSQIKSTATLRSAATCTADATYYYTCSLCGEIDKTDTHYFTDTGSMLAHTWDDGIATTEPTCTEKGVKTYTCIVCGSTKSEEMAALGHNYEAVVTAPTCTVQGYTTYTCSRCGDSYVADFTAPLGHEYGEWTQTLDPTCTETGLQTRTCVRGDNVETLTVAALGHDKQLQKVAPTDTKAGYAYYKCSRCDTYWAAEIDSGTGEFTPSDTSASSLADVVAATASIPAPTFNSYSDSDFDYDYSNRGAGLKLDNIPYTDENTTQDTRFTGSMLVPSGVDWTFASTSNSVTDFGFVYSQSDLIDYTVSNLEYGKSNVYKMSVPEQNSGTFDGTNWTGVTAHTTADGTVLTFNLLVGILAKNWTVEYCARAYVTYNYQGFSYTVYDQDFSSRSVQFIAKAVVENAGETAFARNYCQTKILDHIA